jgi:splicing factor 3B subunit 2
MTNKKARKERDASLKLQRCEVLRTLQRPQETPVLVLESDVRDRTEVVMQETSEEVEVTPRQFDDHVVTSTPRVSQKVQWSQLKLRSLEQSNTHAVEASRRVEEHDGNGQDPYFTALLKSVRGSVPVPSHWHMLSEFLSKQADRDATRVVPVDIEATEIRELRASKDPKTFLNMNRIAFVRCFSVGTPLATKMFSVRLTGSGDVFEEGRWYPRSECQPAQLSKELRDALGLKAPTSPAPWLYAMQHMKRLPPAFPFLKVAGVNAPIPEGAQWGGGEGMWGHAPRNDNGSPSFPGVMGEARGPHHSGVPQPWGSVALPALKGTSSTNVETVVAASVPPSLHKLPAPQPPSAPPAPYIPSLSFQMPMTAQQRAGPVREVEYTKTSDVLTGGLVAQGGMLSSVPRAPTGLINISGKSAPSPQLPEAPKYVPAPSTKF